MILARSYPAVILAVSLLAHTGRAGATGDSFVIRAKAVYPVTAETAGPIENGMIIVRDGRIVAVGRDLEVPADLTLIELRDETIVPGFVDAGSSLGGAHTGNESVSGRYDALDAFDPYAEHKLTLARGTTTVHLDPGGHRLVSGRGGVVKLAGERSGRVLKRRADLAVNFGVFDPPSLWEFPFVASSDEAIKTPRRQRPDSRLGQYLELEYRIADVTTLLEQAGKPWQQRGDTDVHALAFAEAWASGSPLRIEVRRAADIEGALSVLRRHGRNGYLVGVSEGDRLRKALLTAGVPVVLRMEQPYSRTERNYGPNPDVYVPDLRVAGRLSAHGIALTGIQGDRQTDLRMIAALAMRGGMSEQDALAAVTRVPAEILGVADRVGSLAPGRDADFAVLTGPPLGVSSHVSRIYVEGREVFRAPPSDALVIKAGTIWVGDGRVIHDASILVENGKIAALGSRVPHPPFAKVIDAGRDGFVSPGFIDAHGHLGLSGDQTSATTDLSLADTVGVAGREFLRVARGGVTTVMLAAYRVAAEGSRVAAVKTFGQGRDDMIIKPVSAIKFSLRGRDPLTGPDAIRKVIEAGKKYEEKWKKYEEELAKWKEDRAKGKTPDKQQPKSETEVEKTKEDPITGTWSFVISGGPLPEEMTATARLLLDGNIITGRITAPGAGEEVELTGTLDGDKVTFEIDAETPLGKPKAEGVLDRPDHMVGQFTVMQFSVDFEGTRTDKTPPEFTIKRRRTRGKDGRPLPPKVNEALEPVRQLLAKKIPALVDVQTAAQIRAVLKLFAEHELLLVLLNADEAADVIEPLKKAGVGVVVPPGVLRQRNRVAYNQAADISRKGIRIALQSNAEDGARNLPLVGLFSVRQGLGGDAALSALTIDAAKMYGIDDRVGSLELGKDADLLIFSGHPFDAGSRLERVIISGREVPDEEE